MKTNLFNKNFRYDKRAGYAGIIHKNSVIRENTNQSLGTLTKYVKQHKIKNGIIPVVPSY